MELNDVFDDERQLLKNEWAQYDEYQACINLYRKHNLSNTLIVNNYTKNILKIMIFDNKIITIYHSIIKYHITIVK